MTDRFWWHSRRLLLVPKLTHRWLVEQVGIDATQAAQQAGHGIALAATCCHLGKLATMQQLDSQKMRWTSLRRFSPAGHNQWSAEADGYGCSKCDVHRRRRSIQQLKRLRPKPYSDGLKHFLQFLRVQLHTIGRSRIPACK